MGDRIKRSNIGLIEDLRKHWITEESTEIQIICEEIEEKNSRETWNTDNMWGTADWKCSRTDDRHPMTDTRSLMNWKQGK